MDDEDLYPCVGVCMLDPESGYCLGCGRPPLPVTPAAAPPPARAVDSAADNADPTLPAA